mmetsp:Transcript_37660/g.93249  ORF Transcript_37660/g.93249 Transcript_37660/m.93249 type:complete len:217 (-) Transcript_37660:130-780(-)
MKNPMSRLSVAPDILLVARAPATAESEAVAAIAAAADHSTFPPEAKEAHPPRPVLTTATSEVPVAACCERPPIPVRRGTMTAPPPRPASDPKAPANRPIAPLVHHRLALPSAPGNAGAGPAGGPPGTEGDAGAQKPCAPPGRRGSATRARSRGARSSSARATRGHSPLCTDWLPSCARLGAWRRRSRSFAANSRGSLYSWATRMRRPYVQPQTCWS